VTSVSGQNRSQRTVHLLWLLLARQLRLTWLLFTKELRELLVSRALWAMVFISAALVGFSFIQAVRLYSQNSASALKLPQLAANQNPLDGIVIPVFSAVYLMNTFLFPFVAIRAIGNEKQTGALKLALQLPIGIYRTVAVKLAALFVGWSIALIPVLSALMIWSFLLGGHLYLPELLSVLLGHALYALVIAGVAFLAAALTESSATAAIVALAFTMAAWILEFAGNTSTGVVRAVAGFSLTPALRGLEQGLVGSPTALALLVLALGFLALTVVWLPPGVNRREKLLRSGAVVGVAFQALLLAVQLPIYMDVTEDQRNSFNPADARALSEMTKELKVDVNLASNDSRFVDLQRQVLAKLPRTAPHVTINYAETSTSSLLGGTSGANYGLVTYTYGGKQGTSRATTAREVLPLIEALSGQTVAPDPVKPYPGFPLVTSAEGSAVWFYALLPLLAVAGWWYFQQPPQLPGSIRAPRAQVRSRWPWLDPYVPALRRTAIGLSIGLFVIQFVPYGRSHNTIQVAPTPLPAGLAGQWCPTSFAPGSESTMTLGAFRQQIGGMQTTLDSVLGSLGAADSASLVGQYSQLAVSYGGVTRELAELYPIRCPRLLGDRVNADAAILGPRLDPAAAGPALVALRAGLGSTAVDLDQRISQASPNGLVGNQDEATADTPIVSGTPAWDSQRTQDLATRACAACHSNTPGWSWYSNVAPLSWLVQHNVDAGRAAMNLSEWDVPQPNATLAAARVQDGSMPPAWAGAVDPRLQLTDAERAQLVNGLQTTFNTLPPPAASTPAADTGTNSLLVVMATGIVLAALALAFRRAGPTRRPSARQISTGRM
jgi:ABC-type transport system involved in multi-copper enzyme maturation permease subunit/mono/diheme cytochrome c family protein